MQNTPKMPAHRDHDGNSPEFCLRVVESPDDRAVGMDLVVPEGILVMGRHEGTGAPEIVDNGWLRLADLRMSRRHLELRTGTVPGTLLLRDQGSKNGTWVNGQRVQRCTLSPQDVLRAGDTLFVQCAAVTPIEARYGGFGGLAGVSGAMVAARSALALAVDDLAPLLVVGEKGAGCEFAALQLHTRNRRKGRFVTVRVAEIPHALQKAELLGALAGAVPDIDTDRSGLIAAARRGTLFLDEVGLLNPETRVALARVLDSGFAAPVGGGRPVKVDIRLVAATARPLDSVEWDEPEWDELMALLGARTLRLPPLRERCEDILHLWNEFVEGERLERRADAATCEALLAYPWPGNVGELKRAADQAVLRMEETGQSSAKVLPLKVFSHYREARELSAAAAKAAPSTAPAGLGAERLYKLKDADKLPPGAPNRNQLFQVLKANKGDLEAVAQHFGTEWPEVFHWVEHYSIDMSEL